MLNLSHVSSSLCYYRLKDSRIGAEKGEGMKTLGIDVAFRKSGILLLDENKKILYKETLVIPAKYDFTESIVLLDQKFTATYIRVAAEFGEADLVVEDILAGAMHIKSALAIHAARAVCIAAYARVHQNLTVRLYTPNDVKACMTGTRAAKKEEVLAKMQIKFPEYTYNLLTEDEIDALGLCLTDLTERTSIEKRRVELAAEKKTKLLRRKEKNAKTV